MLLAALTAAITSAPTPFATIGLPSLLTWAGVVVLVMVSLVRGWLVPKASHEREVAILERRIDEKHEEAREWRLAYQAEQAVAQEVRLQNRMLLEQGQTSTHALEGIRSSLIRVAAAEPTKDVAS